jgi:hypothetical protein
MRYLLLILFLHGGVTHAQNRWLSLGVDAGMPVGDLADQGSLIFGPALGYEFGAGAHVSLAISTAWMVVLPQTDFSDHIERWTMVPLQAGVKYFLGLERTGVYIQGQAGVHVITFRTAPVESGGMTIQGVDNTDMHFSYGLGPGLQLPRWDMGLRVNAIAPPSDAPEGARASMYLAMRLAWLLSL